MYSFSYLPFSFLNSANTNTNIHRNHHSIILIQHIPSISTATSHLLTSTKSLLQSLTSWAQGNTDVTEVSSKFVKFGDAYKTLKRSYATEGIDITNLPDIPGRVRSILETSLVLEPSQASLDKFLPQIGDSVAELMKMLKEKQTEPTKRVTGSISASSSTASFKQNTQTQPSTATSGPSPASEIGRTPSKDAITRLQNNTDLMRRASKRFSAYQTSSIISMQSPTPENVFDTAGLPKTPLEIQVTATDIEKAKRATNLENLDEIPHLNSSTKEKREKLGDEESHEKEETLNDTAISLSGGQLQYQHQTAKPIVKPFSSAAIISTPPQSQNTQQNEIQNQFFLKLKNEVKKVEISLPITIPKLKVLFTQKFKYSPPGISAYPKFYIQDEPSSIAYELEDISDIKFGSIISLHQEDIRTAIFKHVDDQIGTVKNDMMNMEDRILKRIEKLQLFQTSTPVSPAFRQTADMEFEKNMKNKLEKNSNDQKLVDDLEDEINKIKQHQKKSVKKLNDMVNITIKTLDEIQADGLVPQNISENTYVMDCKSKVSNGCESLVEKLDDLQDVIEFIKRDITKHNIKPSDKQLDHLSKEMVSTKAELASLTDYTQIERKNLQAMWNKQMQTIAVDQRFFKAQEEIIGLLAQDYQSAQETFELIVSCAKQLEKGSLAYRSKLPVPDPTVSPLDASKLVMGEIDAINPNHEERVEAIMKAERVREMEKELKLKDPFQEELGDFVINDKLKKSIGGISELERVRQEKDREHIKSTLGVV